MKAYILAGKIVDGPTVQDREERKLLGGALLALLGSAMLAGGLGLSHFVSGCIILGSMTATFGVTWWAIRRRKVF